MEQVTAQVSQQLPVWITIVLSISGFLIVFLLGIIGWFIVELRSGQKEVNAELFKQLHELGKCITGLGEVLTSMKGDHKSLKENYEEHKVVCGYPYTSGLRKQK